MAQVRQGKRQQHKDSDPAWEDQGDEAAATPGIPQRDDVPKPKQEIQLSPSPPLHLKATKDLTQRERHFMRSRHCDMVFAKTDPEAYQATTEENLTHSPLHLSDEYPLPPGRDEDKDQNVSLRSRKQDIVPERKDSFHSEKKSEEGPSESAKPYRNDDEISTAGTTGSNSSSLSSIVLPNPKFDPSVIISGADSDQELELYSRQIRMELRQSEMLELAAEAERAAAAGRKSFCGRASTFGGDDSNLEFLAESSQRIRPLMTRRRKVDFGTPLKGRSQTDQSKISVVALRDVNEVVPPFRDFHMHLRTHFARRRVKEDMLVFEEEGDPHSSHEKHDGSHGEQNVMDLLSSFNFGKWGSSKFSFDGNEGFGQTETSGKAHMINAKLSEASEDSTVGDMLAEHTPPVTAGGLRPPKLHIPPGLKLLEEVASIEKKAGDDLEIRAAAGEHDLVKANSGSIPLTPERIDRTGATAQRRWIGTSSSAGEHLKEKDQSIKRSAPLQDGSLHSPIIIEGIYNQDTPERKPVKLYRGQSPIPGLPLIPQENFSDVFEFQFNTSKELTFQNMHDPYTVMSRDFGVRDSMDYDFDTPVRLRGIRAEHQLNTSSYGAHFPNASFPRRDRSAALSDKCDFSCVNLCNTSDVQESSFTSLPESSKNSREIVKKSTCRIEDSTQDQDDGAMLDSALNMASTFSEQNDKQSGANPSIGGGVFSSRERLEETVPQWRSVSRISSISSQAKTDPEDKYIDDGDGWIRRCLSMPIIEEAPRNQRLLDEALIRKGYSYDCERARRAYVTDDEEEERTQKPSLETKKPIFPVAMNKPGRFTQLGHLRLRKDDCHPDKVMRTKGQQSCLEKLNKDNLCEEKSNVKETSIIDMNGIEPTPVRPGPESGDSKQASRSKATNDFRCECLISPTSSLESDEGVRVNGPKRSLMQDYSAWNLIEARTDPDNQPLKAAVAMFSKISPTGNGCRGKLPFASSKENDDFMSNYLYCSKTDEVPYAVPICAAPPCHDTQMPCGSIAVDTCIGNLLETALQIFPKKTEGKKLFNVSRDKIDDLEGKQASWYDMANERFDVLLERLIGNDHGSAAGQWQTFQAPSLRERRIPTQPESSAPHNEVLAEVYDEDLGGLIYVQNSNSLEASYRSVGLNHQRTFYSNPREEKQSLVDRDVVRAPAQGRHPERRLRYTLSEGDQRNILDEATSSLRLGNRYSM